MAIGFTHLLGHLRALRHAAAQADDLLGVGLFRVGQGAEIAVHALFRVVADGAGVEHDDVGLLGPVRKAAAHRLQHTHDVLAVGHVLLAAEGVHHRQRRLAAAAVNLSDFAFKFTLAKRLRLVQQHFFSVQWKPPAPRFRQKGDTTLL